MRTYKGMQQFYNLNVINTLEKCYALMTNDSVHRKKPFEKSQHAVIVVKTTITTLSSDLLIDKIMLFAMILQNIQ